eukprot:m.350286 g.350286  ORF g.350286 m.350286 type:complete len:527 (-) comp27966_c0_seq4:213-1793(-)
MWTLCTRHSGHGPQAKYLLSTAAEAGDEKACQQLLRFGFGQARFEVNSVWPPKDREGGCNETPLHHAATNGDIGTIKCLVKHGANLQATADYVLQHVTVEGVTPLHNAAKGGHFEAVKYLVSKGADVNAWDEAGYSALYFAAECDDLPSVKFLLESGADLVEDGNDRGPRPLLAAVKARNWAIINCLLEAGDNPATASDVDHTTPLHFAAEAGELPTVKLLVEHGADVHATGGAFSGDPLEHAHNNAPPLLFAAKNGHVDVMKYLVEKGADPMAAARNNMTSIICLAQGAGGAQEEDYLEAIKYLEKQGVDLDAQSTMEGGPGMTALMYAAKYAQFKVVVYLVEHGARIDAESSIFEESGTPLMFALSGPCDKGHRKTLVQFLVQHGARVDAQNLCKETPLHYAVMHNDLDMVEYLVEQGASLDVKHRYRHKTAEQSAKESNAKGVKKAIAAGIEKRRLNERGAGMATHSLQPKSTPTVTDANPDLGPVTEMAGVNGEGQGEGVTVRTASYIDVLQAKEVGNSHVV